MHEADILLHKAAKRAFDEWGVSKIPTVKTLQAERARLMEEKKGAYGEVLSTLAGVAYSLKCRKASRRP